MPGDGGHQRLPVLRDGGIAPFWDGGGLAGFGRNRLILDRSARFSLCGRDDAADHAVLFYVVDEVQIGVVHTVIFIYRQLPLLGAGK